MGSSRRIEKCPQSGWGCMGGGATDHHLEDHLYPVQLYRVGHEKEERWIERWIYHDTRKNNVSLPLFDQRVAVLGGAYIICEKMFLLIFRIECLNNEGSPLYTTVCSIYSCISFYLSPTYTYTEHYVLARLLNATAAVLNDFRSDTESQTSVLRG